MSRSLCAVILALAICSSGSQADAEAGQVPAIHLAIIAARTDATYVHIEGVNFGSSPMVFLGGIPLAGVVVAGAGTQITAQLPAFPPGTYLLHVSAGVRASQNGTFNLTIGAAGPAGPPGADGKDGVNGLNGTDGARMAQMERRVCRGLQARHRWLHSPERLARWARRPER
jgi:hypothetical protein